MTGTIETNEVELAPPPPGAAAERRYAMYEPRILALPTEEDSGPHLGGGDVRWGNGLVIRAPNWLGDNLMALPAVYQLRRFIPPPCGLFVACPAGLAALWQAVPWVDQVIPFHGPRVVGPAKWRLRALGAGVGVVLPNSFGSAWDFWGMGLGCRVGRGGRWRRWMLTHTLPPVWLTAFPPGSCHQLSEYLELVAMFGPAVADAVYPPLVVPELPDGVAKLGVERAAAGTVGWLAMAPGAAFGTAKQWAPEQFRKVATWWTAKGGRVVALGTRREAAAVAAALEGVPGGVNLAGKTSLHGLMAVLREVRLVLANDSGIMHLAAGLGRPGVALFGCTNPVATGPLGARWVIVREALGCAPCFGRTCMLTNGDCLGLRQIPASLVCEAIEYLIDAGPA